MEDSERRTLKAPGSDLWETTLVERPDYHFKMDDEWMVALGRLTFGAAYLDGTLSTMLMRLISTDAELGERLIADATSQWIIDRVRALAHLRFPEGGVRDTFDEWLREVEAVRRERNRIVHSVWYAEIDSAVEKPVIRHGLMRMSARGGRIPFKKTMALTTPDEIHAIAHRLESAGLRGVGLMGPVRALMGELTRPEPRPATPAPPPEP